MTTTHPNSLDLEAFACGDAVGGVDAHVAACDACRTFVERARGLAAPKIDLEAAAPHKVFRLPHTATLIALPVVAAAALIMLLHPPREARVDRLLIGTMPSGTAGASDTTATATEPTTSFKGVRQVAVIRERDGEQKRFTGRVPVKAGDRLRVEVAIDREQTILAGVLGEDGSYLELMPAAVRAPGTHYSEKSARVSAPPSNGTILVGTEEEITRAKQHQPTSELDQVRVEWESTP